MPPPPPPSKSYTLVIDTSSEEEDNDDEEEESENLRRMVALESLQQTNLKSSPNSSSSNSNNNNNMEAPSMASGDDSMVKRRSVNGADDVKEENGSHGDLEEDFPSISELVDYINSESPKQDGLHGDESGNNGKKKKRKKKKKSKKKKKNTNSDTTSNNAPRKPPVSFGSVSVHEYRRTIMDVDGVPAEGGWPLGLCNECVREFDVIDGVDGFEQRKQEELRIRWQTLDSERIKRERKRSSHHHHGSNDNSHDGKHRRRKKSKVHASVTNDDSHPEPEPIPVPDGILETRQFDYRKSPSKEQLRKQPTLSGNGKNPLFSALSEDRRKTLLLRDALVSADDPDHHFDDTTHDHHDDTISSRENSTRSDNSSQSHSSSNVYSTTDIMHIRHELESIRNGRSGEGSLGCTCRKLAVHIHDPSTSSRRSNHRRMPERKVKEELRRRGLLSSNEIKTLSRDDLERRLYDVVQSEPCCWSDDCPCVRDGINCQADSCSCWHPGHDVCSKKTSLKNLSLGKDDESVESIQRKCGNQYGMYVVDLARIQQHRKAFLQPSAMESESQTNSLK